MDKVKLAFGEAAVKKWQWRNILLKKISDAIGTAPKIIYVQLLRVFCCINLT